MAAGSDGYFASKSAKSLALEQRISSICRASTSAVALSASIFEASRCRLSGTHQRSAPMICVNPVASLLPQLSGLIHFCR
jgi:hypothetical protein